MSGNWGFEFIDHVRSRRPWRTRLALTIACVVAGLTLIVVSDRFRAGMHFSQVDLILGLLVLGVVFGLRPWARK
jgi:hypothetical protein